jgi:hypothetical protein
VAYIFDTNSPDPERSLERPLTAEQRRGYGVLVAVARKTAAESEGMPSWKKVTTEAQPRLDSEGHPYIEVALEGEIIPVGLCRANALRLSGSPELVQELALTRMEMELKSKKPARTSEKEVRRDWQLFQDAREVQEASLNRP